MEELKNKFIEAINSIDFTKLSLYELQTVASISDTVDKLAKKDYAEMLADTLSNTASSNMCCCEKPKTIAEMGKES